MISDRMSSHDILVVMEGVCGFPGCNIYIHQSALILKVSPAIKMAAPPGAKAGYFIRESFINVAKLDVLGGTMDTNYSLLEPDKFGKVVDFKHDWEKWFFSYFRKRRKLYWYLKTTA